MAKTNRVKLVALGDGAVGKTCLYITFVTNKYPTEYIPTSFDNYIVLVPHKGRDYELGLWDTAGGEDYDRLRPLCYPQTDIFIICYDVANRVSFENVKDYWFPELDRHCPETPRLIVGCKTDLRALKTPPDGGPMVTYGEGFALAKSLNARYCETSSLKHKGLKECFKLVVELGVLNLEHTHRSKSLFSNARKKGPIIPPVLPPPGKTPKIEISKSTFADEWYSALHDSKFHDVTFIVEEQRLCAHRILLCAASTFFNKVFRRSFGSVASQAHELNSIDGFSREDLNSGKVEGIKAVYDREDSDNKSMFVLELSDDIPAKMFVRVLEFLYTGFPKLPEDAEETEWNELRKVANVFNLPYLAQICTNIINNEEEELNQSIVSYLKDITGSRLKEMFFNKESSQPDVIFNVEGSKVYAHKAVLCTRSQLMAAMLSGKFVEGATSSEISIGEVTKDNFLALLEYLYTDHAPIEQISDIIGLLVLADEKVVPRLVNLCELYITKEVERECQDEKQIEKADVDVIGLLSTARTFNAKNLVNWCLDFISLNYVPFSNRQDFPNLQEEDRKYVEENRWPPLSYLEELEEYEKQMAGGEKKDRCSVM